MHVWGTLSACHVEGYAVVPLACTLLQVPGRQLGSSELPALQGQRNR